MGKDFDIRYHKLIDFMKLSRDDRILEIGSLPPACLSSYVSSDTCYCGINKEAASRKYRIKKIDFFSNKFKNNEFTHSIAIDTLEHVKREDREKFIEEMVRVTKKMIVIAVPNPEVLGYEKIVCDILAKHSSGKKYIHFFNEHKDLNIPSRKEMAGYLKRFRFSTKGSFNLKYWVGIMLGDVFKYEINIGKIRDLNSEPTYRTFYIIKK